MLQSQYENQKWVEGGKATGVGGEGENLSSEVNSAFIYFYV
jgi:hypothetical protein